MGGGVFMVGELELYFFLLFRKFGDCLLVFINNMLIKVNKHGKLFGIENRIAFRFVLLKIFCYRLSRIIDTMNDLPIGVVPTNIYYNLLYKMRIL